MERGQTTLDFAVGVSIFIFSIVFVFAFVPGTLQPFTQTAQDETAGSNRVADLVVKDLLADPGEPYLLDGECTRAMMERDQIPSCDFNSESLSSKLGLSSIQSFNITMHGDVGYGSERLGWDSANKKVVNATTGDITFATGETPPPNRDSVVTARRSVSIDGTNAVVQVRLW